ncbi:unnamed protein product [Rotaria socialis]|uniref:ABC transporter domain-containing protein n=1 Tax=Rotaria socialis TaxID=392032 RepID=A0A821TUZ2_9BILA|nr:unnamed protein product [Rotaria socialis]
MNTKFPKNSRLLFFFNTFSGEYGIPLDWNFLFKRDYWRSETIEKYIHSFSNGRSSLSRRNFYGTSIVHVNHLVKKFDPDTIAVNDVTFDLCENQITSLLGPNGSGKTTIFNCLIGIHKKTSDQIIIENEDGISFDTQTNIPRDFRKNKEQIPYEMRQLVNLQSSKDLYCNSLSGGMKRRLSLACAFIGDTTIILLDEPPSGLDPSNRRLLWDWLRSMKKVRTLLLTTHFMEESDALSDRIMIIANGNIKADGTSVQLKEQYDSVINKRNNCHISDGDVVFRTNQQRNDQFVQALRHLEVMQKRKSN